EAGHGWRVIGASVQGRSHRRANMPCQDAHRWAPAGAGNFVAAVADGAGSSACADIGARLAAESAVDEARTLLGSAVPGNDQEWIGLLQAVFRAGRAVLHTQADDFGFSVSDFATTLLVVIATPERLAVGQIGDGAVVARLQDGSFRAL